MNPNIIDELFASNKKLNLNFNKYQKEQNIILEKINIKINQLEQKINNIDQKINIKIDSNELNSIKKKINNNLNKSE